VIIDFQEKSSTHFWEVLCVKVFGCEDALTGYVVHMTGSDECGQLKRVNKAATGDKVPRGIKVRCRMRTHVDVSKFRHIAIIVACRLSKTHIWMTGPDGCRIG
jgi:hypothetical protein